MIQTTPAPDALMSRYYDLANTTEIPDVDSYALDWFILARDFDADGRPAMADMCRSRGDFYNDNEPGVYVRVIEGSFSTFEKVEA